MCRYLQGWLLINLIFSESKQKFSSFSDIHLYTYGIILDTNNSMKNCKIPIILFFSKK